ncbi:MAG: protoporphyrinogen oxidase HemJ, partial [Verrucomicrobiota bacterium]
LWGYTVGIHSFSFIEIGQQDSSIRDRDGIWPMIMNMLVDLYPWIKAVHVIAMVSWMAGLFYLPRLFVHHAEQAPPGSEMSGVFAMMERKLYRLIMNPAMMVTWGFGLVLILSSGGVSYLAEGWFHIKLFCVAILTGFHVWLGRRQKEFAADRNRLSGKTYRIANEVPTVLLIVIVVMVMVRPF